MVDQTANAVAEGQIYQTLDPTKKQTRVLELRPGLGDALVDAVLIVTSIPPQTPILPPDWELKGLLSQKEAEQKKLLALTKLQERLKAEKNSMDTEVESLKTQVRQWKVQTLSTSEVEEVKLRFDGLRSQSERYQRSKHQIARMAKQVGVFQQDGGPAAESKEVIVGNLGSIDPTKSISTLRSDDGAQPSRINKIETLQNHATMIRYEAVSYCWNNCQTKNEMRLNGVLFKAPSSAIDVLCNLRFADSPRLLWIDAICINQDDLVERGQQVAMMGDIYSRSSKTLAWLGPSLDDTKTQSVFQLCSAVAQQITGARELHDLPDIDSVASNCQSVSAPDEHSPNLLDIVFARRWFTRLWVWQEVALSPHCICQMGRFTIPWQDIMLTAFWWIEIAGKYADLPPESLPSEVAESNMHFPSTIFMTGFNLGPKKPSYGARLSEIVQQSRHCEVTNPKDKIFGLLGMTRWSKSGHLLPAGIQPNYHESVRNCMRNATRVMIEEDQNLNVLSNELLDGKKDPELEYEAWPSWTPVWCMKIDFETAISLDGTYNAHNGRALPVGRLTDAIDPDTLTLDGYEVDGVEETVLIPGNCFVDLESAPADFQSLHKAVTRRTPILPQTLLRTLLADRYENSKVAKDNQIIKDFVDHLTRGCDLSVPPQCTQSTDEPYYIMPENFSLEVLDSVRRELRDTSGSRQLFMTKSGRAGIGPRSISEHDTVVVLFGGQWPFILREEAGQYLLVGHCYVQGLMDGEAVRDLEARGIPVKTFQIH